MNCMPRVVSRYAVWLFVSFPLGCMGGKPSAHAAAPPPAAALAASVTEFGVSVLDLEHEGAFLRALDFKARPEVQTEGAEFAELVSLPGARARQQSFDLGEQHLRLSQFLEPTGRSLIVASARDLGFEHIAIVVRNMDDAYARLATTPFTPVSSAPQRLPASNPVAGGVRAEYFRDPEGHFMELIEFPADKGDPMWHRPSSSLFLGVDHSAIACKDSERSLRFYRDALGLSVKSQSLNEGVEQERLSGVPGARVRVTSLRGSMGPGIELLEYVAPTGGAPFPAGTPADSVHWEIAIEVSSVAAALRALRAAGFASGASSAPAPSAVLVTDPDGHTLRLFEAAHVSGAH